MIVDGPSEALRSANDVAYCVIEGGFNSELSP